MIPSNTCKKRWNAYCLLAYRGSKVSARVVTCRGSSPSAPVLAVSTVLFVLPPRLIMLKYFDFFYFNVRLRNVLSRFLHSSFGKRHLYIEEIAVVLMTLAIPEGSRWFWRISLFCCWFVDVRIKRLPACNTILSCLSIVILFFTSFFLMLLFCYYAMFEIPFYTYALALHRCRSTNIVSPL